MLTNAMAVAEAYLETWNEADAPRRQRLLQQAWSGRASYVDPSMKGDGPQQIDALVAAVHARFPGFRFRLLGTPDGHGDIARLRWSLGPAEGEAPIEGSDVIRLSDGRIHEVIGFIDKAPAGA